MLKSRVVLDTYNFKIWFKKAIIKVTMLNMAIPILEMTVYFENEAIAKTWAGIYRYTTYS